MLIIKSEHTRIKNMKGLALKRKIYRIKHKSVIFLIYDAYVVQSIKFINRV